MRTEPTSAATAVAPVATVHRMPSDRVFHVALGRWAFVACWWLVMGLHMFLGGFALSAATLHWYLQQERVAMAMSALNMPKRTLELTAYVFFLVGFAHCFAMARVLSHCYRARQLVLHAPRATQTARPATGIVGRIRSAFDAAKIAWDKLFGPTGFFGFSNPHFEMVFLFREGSEIVLQTYQAFKLSESVPRKWINQLAAAVIVLNCAGSPIVHLVFRRHDGRRRVVNLLQDAVLDFSCSIVIPLSILVPYTGTYNTKTNQFPDELIMDDTWFVNAVAEMRQVLVTSFPDFISTIMPQLSLLGYLMTFKNLLRRRSARIHDRPVLEEKVPSLKQPHDKRVAGPALVTKRDAGTSPQPSQQQRQKSTARRRLINVVAHVLFVFWGCGVLGLHLDAYRNEHLIVPGCQLHVSAWHSSRYPCSMMQLNCHANQFDGSAAELTPVFDLLERASLRVLVFTHCPQLTIPPVVTEFDQLAGIELFNCTLVDWSEQAAITDARQPLVGYIYFILTNWTSFPAGLLHDQLPTRFTHVFVVASNLTNLPEAIGVWSSQQWISVIFERVPFLTHLPRSICTLRTTALWFTGSGITSFPSACATFDVLELGVSGSALRSLPDTVGPNLQLLYAEDTNIAELPGWFDTWYHSAPAKVAAFHGSPLCDSPELYEDASLWNKTCRSEKPFAKVAYPLDLMQHFRPFDHAFTQT